MCGCPAVHRYVIGNRCGHFWHASRSSRKNQPNTRRPSQSLAALRCYSEAFFLRSLTVPPAEGYGRVERHPRFSLSPILPLSFIQETRRNRICGSTVSGLTAVANIMLRKGAHTKKKTDTASFQRERYCEDPRLSEINRSLQCSGQSHREREPPTPCCRLWWPASFQNGHAQP